MTETTETVDLWGDIVTEPVRTPLTILKEQGALLERKTNGVLTTEVRSSSGQQSNSIRHSFMIKASSLNYAYMLFSLEYNLASPFPVNFIEFEPVGTGAFTKSNEKVAKNEGEFLELLKKIFQSPDTQRIIATLLTQSAAV